MSHSRKANRKGTSLERSHSPRVLIADDHTLVAESLRKLLESEFSVVGTVADGRALLRAVPELKPDVIVLDIGMPLLNGLDAGEQVKQKTAYEISECDWSSDVCSSDLNRPRGVPLPEGKPQGDEFGKKPLTARSDRR